MKKLKAPYVWIAVMVFAASLIGAGFWNLGKLHEYRAFIESEYISQLSAMEFAMKSGAFALNDEADFEYYERREATQNKLAASFPEADVFFISWSSDGHHGIESLKNMPCSEVRPGLLSSTDAAGSHKLRLASGSDGTSLIWYEGWVKSNWKRQYEVAFRRSAVDAKMKTRRASNSEGSK